MSIQVLVYDYDYTIINHTPFFFFDPNIFGPKSFFTKLYFRMIFLLFMAGIRSRRLDQPLVPGVFSIMCPNILTKLLGTCRWIVAAWFNPCPGGLCAPPVLSIVNTDFRSPLLSLFPSYS